MNRSPRPARSDGYSLVELLVALALGLFLIAGMAVMYASLSQSYRVEQQTAQLQERERLAATFIGTVVRSAGYYAAPATNYPELVFPADSTFAVAGQSVYGTSGDEGGAPADTLSVRFLTGPGDGVLNCHGYGNAGAAPDAYQLYVNRFQLDARNRQLECALSGPGIAARTQPLLDGVASLGLRYGVDTDGDRSADRYLPASVVEDWTAVRSVKITLEFAAAGNPVTGVPDSKAAPIGFSLVVPIRARVTGQEDGP